MQNPPLMIFAAGFGTRMGPITQTTPKPLIQVAGRALIDHALAVARDAGIARIVINLHHLGAQIQDHLAGQDVTLIWEKPHILETGGGLKAALPLFEEGPVLLLNSDAVWTGENPLLQLLAQWDGAKMDALLLLALNKDAFGHSNGGRGSGDFALAADGRISWAKGTDAPVYLGAQMINPRVVRAFPETIFSLVKIWDQLIPQGRAYGTLHRGAWCDVGTPQGIKIAEGLLDV